jgi:hypothetical protein
VGIIPFSVSPDIITNHVDSIVEAGAASGKFRGESMGIYFFDMVTIILWSGWLHVTSTEPSEVGKRTMCMMLVSTMLIGAEARSVAILQIAA